MFPHHVRRPQRAGPSRGWGRGGRGGRRRGSRRRQPVDAEVEDDVHRRETGCRWPASSAARASKTRQLGFLYFRSLARKHGAGNDQLAGFPFPVDPVWRDAVTPRDAACPVCKVCKTDEKRRRVFRSC